MRAQGNIQNEVELREAQFDSDSGQEDLFGESDSNSSTKTAIEDKNEVVERGTVNKDIQMVWTDIPTELACGLIKEEYAGRNIGAMIAATQCLALNVTVDREGDTQTMLMVAQDWDTRAVD